MRKVITILITLVIFAITPITAHAETFAEKCQRMQKEADEQFLKELEADGNLTQEALDSYKEKTNLKPNKKAKKEKNKANTTTKNSDSAIGKGWVYSADELHVINLPEGEDGYTVAGWYGDIEN